MKYTLILVTLVSIFFSHAEASRLYIDCNDGFCRRGVVKPGDSGHISWCYEEIESRPGKISCETSKTCPREGALCIGSLVGLYSRTINLSRLIEIM
jgi:hypothetical protein